MPDKETHEHGAPDLLGTSDPAVRREAGMAEAAARIAGTLSPAVQATQSLAQLWTRIGVIGLLTVAIVVLVMMLVQSQQLNYEVSQRQMYELIRSSLEQHRTDMSNFKDSIKTIGENMSAALRSQSEQDRAMREVTHTLIRDQGRTLDEIRRVMEVNTKMLRKSSGVKDVDDPPAPEVCPLIPWPVPVRQ
jgi:hypothetical protein